jgi:uncharacterized protein
MKLEIGYNHPFEIRKYSYPFGQLSGVTILYLSDFHYNRFGRRLAADIGDQINRLNPNIILLGGDYADSGRGLHHFKRMMESISIFQNIFAIPGNHDQSRITQIREIIESCNGIWLHHTSATIKIGYSTIRIDGRRPVHSARPADGAPAPLLSNPADFSILCLHQPIDVTSIAHQYNLIFAGHLHGSQAVFWGTDNGLYPGRLVYKWNRLSATFGNCRYLISKGLGDSLPLRYNCRKDAILVEMVSA